MNTVVSTSAKVEQVLERLLDRTNPQTLTQALAAEHISPSTFHKYLSKDRDAAVSYVRAMEMRADLLVDEAMHIVDTEPDAAKARNQADIRKWIATKHNSKRYGERIDLNVSQTIDITATLAEAKARLIRSIDDQQLITNAETRMLPSVQGVGALDTQANTTQEPDIFS